MAKQKAQPNGSAKTEKKSFGEWFAAYRARNVENRPNLGGQIDALTRDAAKQAGTVLNEVMFGRGDVATTAGVPLEPTQQLVSESLKEGRVNPVTDRIEAETKNTLYGEVKPQVKNQIDMKIESSQTVQRGRDFGPLTVDEIETPEQSPEIAAELERMRGRDRGIEL